MGDKRPRPVDHAAEKLLPDEPEPLNPATDAERLKFWSDFSNPQQRAFLAALSQTYRICDAIRAARISHERPWRWARDVPGFKEAMKKAKAMAAEFIESEAVRRAVVGVRRKKFYKGEPVMDPATGKQYIEHVHSDYLMAKLLEATKPKKYRRRIESQQTTTIVTEVPQQGQSLIQFFRERAIVSLSPPEEPLVIEHHPAAGHNGNNGHNGNGNGKHHGSNGNGDAKV